MSGNGELQKHYEAMIERLTPLMPKPNRPPVEYAAAAQALLTCAVNVCMKCYHINDADGEVVIKKAWDFIGTQCQQISDSKRN